MKKIYRSILVCAVTFMAFVCLSVQANAVTSCVSDLQCPKFYECIRGVCVSPAAGCVTSRDCDDGLFCNGAEWCSKLNECVDGIAPCTGEICVEADDECIECEDDLDCEEGETCEDDVCEGICPYPMELWEFDEDANCSFSKDEMKAAKTFYKDEHKAEKNALKESQGEDKALLRRIILLRRFRTSITAVLFYLIGF